MRSSSVSVPVLFVVTILVCFGHSPAAADPPMKMRKPDAAGGGFNGGRQRGASDAPWLINDLTGLLEARESPKFWLGITCTPADAAMRSQLGLLDGQGLVVREVRSESPAWRAGIFKHDVLVTANGQTLKTGEDLIRAVDDIDGDGTVKLSLIRKGKPVEVLATPAKWIGVGQREVKKGSEFLDPTQIRAGGKTQAQALDDDVTIAITRQGKKPATIHVTKGDKSWDLTGRDLSQLPADLRQHVEVMLGRLPPLFEIAGENVRFSVPPPAAGPESAGAARELRRVEDNLTRRLEAMEGRLDELRGDVRELHDLLSREPRREPNRRNRDI